MAALKTMSLQSEIDGRSPLSTPCIRHLRMPPPSRYYTLSVESNLHLLSVLGEPLQTLDVAKRSTFDAQQTRRLLHYCPNLHSLAIYHDGSAWSEESIDLPRLEHPHLSLESTSMVVASFSNAALQTGLRQCVLRITAWDARFDESRGVILRLLKKLPTLSYLHWLNESAKYYLGRGKPNGVVPYDESRQRTMDKLSANGTIALSQHVTHYLPTSTSSNRIALLSALHTEQGKLPMTNDVAGHVMALALPRVPRALCVEE